VGTTQQGLNQVDVSCGTGQISRGLGKTIAKAHNRGEINREPKHPGNLEGTFETQPYTIKGKKARAAAQKGVGPFWGEAERRGGRNEIEKNKKGD